MNSNFIQKEKIIMHQFLIDVDVYHLINNVDFLIIILELVTIFWDKYIIKFISLIKWYRSILFKKQYIVNNLMYCLCLT